MIDKQFDPDSPYSFEPVATNFMGYHDLSMFFIICPAHEMKNLINALHHSQARDTRSFCYGPATSHPSDSTRVGTMGSFGWQPIHAIFKKDNNNANRGIPRRCPRLTQDTVDRPAFFKMNVGGALAVTHGDVAAAIRTDHPEAARAAEYLDAIRAIYTYGLMFKRLSFGSADSSFLTSQPQSQPSSQPESISPSSSESSQSTTKTTAQAPAKTLDPISDPITDDENMPDDDAIQSMGTLLDGFSFFVRWRENLVAHVHDFDKDHDDPRFLSPVTYFLLACSVHGFRGFCLDFFRRHGNYQYRLYPVRFTGSALELFFCNMRQMRGTKGALTEAQYQSNVAAYVVNQETKTALASASACARGLPGAHRENNHRENANLDPKTPKQAHKRALKDINHASPLSTARPSLKKSKKAATDHTDADTDGSNKEN